MPQHEMTNFPFYLNVKWLSCPYYFYTQLMNLKLKMVTGWGGVFHTANNPTQKFSLALNPIGAGRIELSSLLKTLHKISPHNHNSISVVFLPFSHNPQLNFFFTKKKHNCLPPSSIHPCSSSSSLVSSLWSRSFIILMEKQSWILYQWKAPLLPLEKKKRWSTSKFWFWYWNQIPLTMITKVLWWTFYLGTRTRLRQEVSFLGLDFLIVRPHIFQIIRSKNMSLFVKMHHPITFFF